VPIDAGSAHAFTFATSGGHADFSPTFIHRRVHPTSPLRHVGHLEDAGNDVLSSKAQADRFSEVVLPHLGDALALARWLTGNAADAEDVVQDACVKAHAGIAGYAGGNPRAWLLTIVRNASYTWLARNRPRGVVAVGDLNDLDDMSAAQGVDFPDAESPEASLIAKADTAALEAAIAALPEPFRETLVLRDINGLSYREISAMVGAPIGTVMSRLARARSKLMSDLGRAR
jgi:RNA polymerase sigma-70 factor (ECF subfamily)